MNEVVQNIMAACVRLKLEGAWMLEHYGAERCAAAYNGIGSEAMPSAVRRILDKLHVCMCPAALLHDAAWALDSDGTGEYFAGSNGAFVRNCLVCIDDYYAWYNPVRWWQRHQARRFGDLLDNLGWPAYMAAYKARPKA